MSKLIIEFNKIINSKRIKKLIINELNDIKHKFSVPRRTKIIDAVFNYNVEETIERICSCLFSNKGYIKRSPLTSLKAQKEAKEELA